MGLLSTSPTPCRAGYLWLRLLLAFSLCSSAAYSQTLATTVPLVLPSAIAIDSQGNLYVAETGGHVVRQVSATGNITTIAGTGTQGFDGDGGPAVSALLDSPQGLAVDTKSLYIADSHNHRVRKIDLATGTISTAAGGSTSGTGGDGGPAANATLDLPTALALDGQGNLYIADARSHRVRKVDATGTITTVAGTGAQGFDGDGASATASLLDSPGGLAADEAGNLYVSDTKNNRVRRIDHVSGAISTIAGDGTQGYAGDTGASRSAKLAAPRGLSFDAQGNLYFADAANHRIRRIDRATGTITTLAGDGTQGFGGDGGAPVSASLDSARGVGVSPGGNVNIADTGNARVRQIAGDLSLQTVAGLGVTTPGALTLTGPSVVSYGTGQLTATLTSPGATGNVTFLDSYGGGTIATPTLVNGTNAAMFDASTLQAGQHSITATYGGDQTHGPARSAAFSLTIIPKVLEAAAISPGAVAYGQAVPPLSGQLIGVLDRDAASVSATFTTTATALSPAGIYPVTVALAGLAAGNYTVATASSFEITKAATTAMLAVAAAQPGNGTTVNAGQAVMVTVHVLSATSGMPTGTVAIFDGGAVLSSVGINASGNATFSTSTLDVGNHNFTAVYSGDGNFTGSTSLPSPLTVISSPAGTEDFALTATGTTTQTAVAGSAASFAFTVQPQAGLSSQVALTAAGLPPAATASFNPAYVPPGSSTTPVTLTISTPKAYLRSGPGPVAFGLLFFPIVGGLGATYRYRRRGSLLAVAMLLLPLALATGCGDRVFTGNSAQTTKTYTITVTGTATSTQGSAIQHATTVTLAVVSAN
ncbi:MAG: Ig-like domain repeat protein [Acidobacteria bacterium]|nr:Ig-like domain repeat protein [Acidobacteriota bacterium]